MFLQVKALVYMLDCLELPYYPPKLFPCTHEAQTCLYHIKQEDCHTDDTLMAVWWVPMEMWGSSIFFLLLVVFPVFFFSMPQTAFPAGPWEKGQLQLTGGRTDLYFSPQDTL